MDGYVLVVEDDGELASLIGEILTEEMDGTKLVHVSDAAEALAAVKMRPPQVALIDLMLPADSGLEIAALLRHIGEVTAPFVAMTGSKSLAKIARESDLFQMVLEKPFDLDDLLLCITEFWPAPGESGATPKVPRPQLEVALWRGA